MANEADLGKRAESGSWMNAAMRTHFILHDFDEIDESFSDALT